MSDVTKRITGRGIILHDGNILLMERWREGLHYFSIPGGGVESGETIEQAAVREIAEEMGVVVNLERTLYEVQTSDSVHHIFLCEYVSGEPRLHPDSPEACEHAQGNNKFAPAWIPVGQISKLPFEYWEPLRPQLLHDLKNGFATDTKIISM